MARTAVLPEVAPVRALSTPNGHWTGRRWAVCRPHIARSGEAV